MAEEAFKRCGADTAMTQSKKEPDWQVVTICYGFVIEVDCNSGKRRRVYKDGRIEVIK